MNPVTECYHHYSTFSPSSLNLSSSSCTRCYPALFPGPSLQELWARAFRENNRNYGLIWFQPLWIKRCSLRLLKCIWSYRLGGMMNRCARLMQRKRWLHDSRGTLQNTGHLCSDLYIEKSDTESAPAIFQISHFNESHLYVHDFTVHRGRTSIEAGGISLKVCDWSTSSGSTSFCLYISFHLLLLLHACESNYRLSFLVKKIQISIIESRWCGSMCVCGGEGRGGCALQDICTWMRPVLRGEVGTPWSQLAAVNKAAWAVASSGFQSSSLSHRAQVWKGAWEVL